jgi:GAF domain-containing protein/CheY-like chemotaxis protein/anti-sigma regulatory factor (Ser/Thr protein kinase)
VAADLPEVEGALADDDWDVLLADADPPGASAPGLLERLQRLGGNVPLIVITGETSDPVAAEVVDQGAYDYVTEPVDLERLKRTLERAAEHKRLLDEADRLRQENQAYEQELRREVRERTAELEKSNEELRTLAKISREISATLELDQILKRVTQLAADVCGAHRCTIVLIGDDGKMSAPAMSSFSDGHEDERLWRLFKDESYPVSLSQVPEAAQVVREQRPLFIADVEASSLPKRLTDPFNIKSILLVPLVSETWVIGLMALDHVEQGRRFTPRQMQMAVSIAAQATMAIEKARLYRQARRQARHGALLSVVAQQVNAIIEPERLLPVVAEAIHEHFGYDSVMLLLIDAREEDLVLAGKAGVGTESLPDDYRQPFRQGLMGWAAHHGECVVSNDTAREERYFAPFPDRYRAGSELAVPLTVQGEVVGVLDLQCQERGSFDELDTTTARTLAQQIGTALQNAGLYDEAQRHVEELTALHNIDLAITSTLSLDDVLHRVYEQVSGLMDATTFYIGLYDERKDKLHVSLVVDEGKRLEPISLDVQEGGGFAGWVVRHEQPLWIEHWEEERDTLPVEGIARGRPTQSLMVAPLVAKDELIGVISTQSYEPYAFDEDHRRLFDSIASQVAIAVENARLFGEVKRRLKEMRLLQRIILAASSTLDFDQVLTRTIETLQDTLDIERLAFALPDEEESSLVIHPSTIGYSARADGPWYVPIDESIMGRAYGSGRAVLVSDVTDVSSSLEGEPATRTELAVPVRDGDEVVAVLNAESRVLEEFDEDDLSLFSAAAAQLGVVLKNARLFEQTRQRLTETRLLQQVMQAAATSLDFDQVLERTVDTLHRRLGIEHLSFALPMKDGRALRLHPSQIGYSPEVTDVRIPLEESLAGRAYLTGETQVVDDLRKTDVYFELAPDVLSGVNVPVRVAGRVVAVLNVESPRTSAFHDDDLHLFEAVAAQLGIVLENARLYETLQEQRDELSQAYEELKEVDRLRTELVQNVSHELRTPFTLVQGYIELLMAGDLGPLSEKQREALIVIQKRVETLQRRTRDLTTLDSLSRNKVRSRPTCIVEAARCALADLEPSARGAGVQLSDELPGALPPVIANKNHLVQAFTHLIENAIKFSPDGGTITVRAWAEQGRSYVAVDDEGIGIDPKHLDHVFERFYQVDGSINRRFGGMGVGLAVVWEIVETYGGSVDVESSPETGSTFTVCLPQARRERAGQSVSYRGPQPGERQGQDTMGRRGTGGEL